MKFTSPLIKCLSVLSTAIIVNVACAQNCTPMQLGNPGFYPKPDSIPCFVSGQQSAQTIYFRMPATAGAFTISYIRIDSISNLPAGVTYQLNKITGQYNGNENGCVTFSGLPTGIKYGQYRLRFNVSVKLTSLPSELRGDLVDIFNAITPSSGNSYFYWLRLKAAPSSACPCIDTNVVKVDSVKVYTGSEPNCQVSSNLVINVLTTQPTCNSASNASLTVNVSGGNPPYQYKLNSQNYQSTNIFSGLNAGSYTVIVKDQNGDSSSALVTVGQPNPLSVSFQTSSSCSSNSGSIVTNVIGGTPQYGYNWSNGSTVKDQSNLQGGKYILTVTDSKGCTLVDSALLNISVFNAQAIIGNPSITPFQSYTYLVNNIQGNTYNWIVQNGAIQSGQGTNSISVIWGSTGPYLVTLIEGNSGNCKDTISLAVANSSCSIATSVFQVGANPCIGDTVVLIIQAPNNTSFQWLKNGSSIPFAVNDSLFVTAQGSYQVQVTNGNCTVLTSSTLVNFKPSSLPFFILASDSNTSCNLQPITLSTSTAYNTYTWSTGATSPSIIVSASGIYSVSVTDQNGCKLSSSFNANFSIADPVEICMVTVDSASGFNLVVWEKPSSNLIDSFVILKESFQSNVYSPIGKVPFNSFSTFLDSNSNSAIQSYRYKISIIDSCGILSSATQHHKTIHLTSNIGVGGVVNLIWSHYEGISFSSYNIYRGTSPQNIQLLTTIASNLNSFTDLTPPTGSVFYFVEVVFGGCNPTAKEFQRIRSNTITLQSVSNIQPQNGTLLSLFPNPSSGKLVLQVASNERLNCFVEVSDLTGRVIIFKENVNLTEGLNNIELNVESSGCYFAKISTNGYSQAKPFIISR